MPQPMDEDRSNKAARGTRVNPRVVRPAIPRPNHNKYTPQKNGLGKNTTTSIPTANNQVENGADNSGRADRKFETFVMTGDMIIQTTPPKLDATRPGSAGKKTVVKDEGQQAVDKKTSPKKSPKKTEGSSKKRPSRIPKPSTPGASPKVDLKRSPVKSSPATPVLPEKEPLSRQSSEDAMIADALLTPTKLPVPVDLYPQKPTSPSDLNISDLPRFPVLDIPPDDISSDDEISADNVSFDFANLPPPPEELLMGYQEPSRSHDSPPPPPLPLSPIATVCEEPVDDIKDLKKHLSGVSHADEPSDSIPCTVQSHDIILETIDENIQIPKSDSENSIVDGYGRFDSESPQKEHKPDVSSYDRQSVCSESKAESTNGHVRSSMVISRSAEKIGIKDQQRSSLGAKPSVASVVRGSKSHENYLEYNSDNVTFVDIDFEDKIASSVDALHYQQSNTSIDSMGYVQFETQSSSLESSPEKSFFTDKKSEPLLMPTFLSVEEPKSIAKLKEGGKLRDFPAQKSGDENSKQDKQSPGKRDSKSSEAAGNKRLAENKSPDPSAKSKDTNSPHTSVTRTHTSVQYSKLSQSERQPLQTDIKENSDSVVTKKPSSVSVPSSSLTRSTQPTSSSGPPPPVRTSSIPQNSMPPSQSSSSSSSSSLSSSVPMPEGYATGVDESLKFPESGDWESSSLYHQPIKDPHRPSAARLAKRLYHLDGFKKGDIVKHLCKKNEFAQMVGEEYLSYFDFSGQTLDVALRSFLHQLTLAGETQERERVLARFSHRYMQCNPNNFCSEDACHTLTCALMLLNTDLHGQNIGRKMTASEFVENLADLNDGKDFPEDILVQLYNSIHNEPLQCEIEDDTDESVSGSSSSDRSGSARFIGHNPFLDVPDPGKAVEYRKGFVMRKCCIDPDGRKTPVGRRGWKMFYATLRDMVIYLHKDEHGFNKSTTMSESVSNCIRIHHALATKATDYKKKQYVFRLQTADWAQYLFQTSDSKECQHWIDTINFVAASLSAPPLPGAVGSQRKFQRQLMPASYTKYNLSEQLLSHEKQLARLDRELHEHRRYPPEKGAKSRFIQEYCEKETYLQFELKRFNMYSFLLQAKMAAFHPELEPSLVEVAIGEVDEPPSTPDSDAHQQPSVTSPPISPPPDVVEGGGASIRRSVSDRRLLGDRVYYTPSNSLSSKLEVVDSSASRSALRPPLIHPKYVYGRQTPTYYETQV